MNTEMAFQCMYHARKFGFLCDAATVGIMTARNRVKALLLGSINMDTARF
jgi:hypothetical protein